MQFLYFFVMRINKIIVRLMLKRTSVYQTKLTQLILILIFLTLTKSCFLLCSECSSQCKSCVFSHSACTSCSDGFYYSGTLSCSKCSSNCKTCNSQSKCLSCNQDKRLLNFVCYSCSIGCDSCASLSLCLNCSANYYLINGTCKSCGSYCSSCISENQCITCFSDSQLLNGKCFPCQNCTLSIQIIIAIVISSIIFLAIIIIICKRINSRYSLQAPAIQNSLNQLYNSQAAYQEQWIQVDKEKFKQICSICLDTGNCQTKCGHIFHANCLLEWVKVKRSCPICRSKIEIATDRIKIICQNCYLWGYMKKLKDLIMPMPYQVFHKCI